LIQTALDPAHRFALSLDAWLSATAAFREPLAEHDPVTCRRIKLRQFGAAE
jgi:hypothetical protein